MTTLLYIAAYLAIGFILATAETLFDRNPRRPKYHAAFFIITWLLWPLELLANFFIIPARFIISLKK